MEEKTMKKVEKKDNGWKANDIQALFLKTVKENPDRTLEELSKIAGVTFKSGSINVLAAKGLIDNTKKKEVKVVRKTKVSVYRVIE